MNYFILGINNQFVNTELVKIISKYYHSHKKKLRSAVCSIVSLTKTVRYGKKIIFFLMNSSQSVTAKSSYDVNLGPEFKQQQQKG